MHTPAKLLARTCTFACILLTVFACSDDDFLTSGQHKTDEKETNAFDFSTSQEVDLIVDYSDFQANIPVFFSVYNRNPFVNENTILEYIDEDIMPIFSGYTDKNGRFDETVTLPAYAKTLHVVTGNFLVGLRRTMTTVENGVARMIVEDPLREAKQRNTRRKVVGQGTPTTDLSQMKHLYCKNDGSQVFKPWVTPLGTWDSNSGRPKYLLDTSDPELLRMGLVLSEEEFLGMYGTACDALNSGTNLKEQYRASADLKLLEDSEISITAMGSSTCWNSSLGYYYYTGDAPTDKMDLNIIMIFPNTQDGEWPRGNYPNNNYHGNIGTLRGDVVHLWYYPNIATGDLTTKLAKFPAGIKIGFILKTNAWGQRGKTYAVNGSYANQKQIWASTTDGLSAAYDTGVKWPNENGEARSAKFAYTAPNGKQYVVVSFEDACDDKDYDDLMFALNPAKVFDLSGTPEIESKRATFEGVYGFEDLWPRAGDYDMNDMVVDCKHELEYYTHPDGTKALNKERFYLTPYHNAIDLQNGLAVDLQASNVSTIYINKLAPGETQFASTDYLKGGSKDPAYYYLREFGWDKNESRMWYLTDDIKRDAGTTYVLEVAYTKSFKKSNATIRPFLWRAGNNGKQVEVHLPWVDPTSKADASLFGTMDDKSDPTVTRSNGQRKYYVGDSKFPFAFYLEGFSIDVFKETILKPENEGKRIDTFFPEFLEWSISDGMKNSDWYLHHVTD